MTGTINALARIATQHQPEESAAVELADSIRAYLLDYMPDPAATALAYMTLAAALVLLCVVANWIAKRWLLRLLSFFVKRTRNKWDDVFFEKKAFTRLSHLAPALVIYLTATALFDHDSILHEYVTTGALVYLYLAAAMFVSASLEAVAEIYQSFQVSENRPIKGYIQAIKLVMYAFVAIFVVSEIVDKSPTLLLSGLGAVTALVLLLFREPIMGFVASIQLAANNMVRPGDWITVPKANADGNVVDVSLTTVKVQNWDKTITTVPIYSLVSDAFTNWRGMSESGGRRIKRAIHVDMTSICFCDQEMLDRFEKIELLGDYIRNRKREIAAYRKERGIADDDWVNGPMLTNIGTFRMYIGYYLRGHSKIHQAMTFLIRQLQAGPNGLPLEVYVFSNDQEWANYEGIQSDIFDHLFAVMPAFSLRVFQNPTGSDFHEVLHTLDRGRDTGSPG